MVEIPKPKNGTVEKIYALYERKGSEQRPYLGASILGGECERALWYGFRWATRGEEFSGRKLRLFETGHREEARLIDELLAAGVLVEGAQDEVVAVGGHVRGHMDGVALGIPEAPKTKHVLEVKTHNEKSYADLWKKGVQKSKPWHYAQMQIYMHLGEYERALYLAVNKNDDTLYVERVKYDSAYAAGLIQKAIRIVRAQKAPPKLHEDPYAREAFVCGWCPSSSICHHGDWARRNCRTCLHSTAVTVPQKPGEHTDGVWRCEYWNTDIPLNIQRIGCSSHRYLPSLVPGKQTDAVEIKRQFNVAYELHNGEGWKDGEDKDVHTA